MSIESVAFVNELVEAFPQLKPMLVEHIRANFGEVLPHVFLGEVTPYVAKLAISKSSDESSRKELQRMLQYLEDKYASAERDGEVENLIAVSFVENLPRPDEPGAEIREMLGPQLTKTMNIIG